LMAVPVMVTVKGEPAVAAGGEPTRGMPSTARSASGAGGSLSSVEAELRSESLAELGSAAWSWSRETEAEPVKEWGPELEQLTDHVLVSVRSRAEEMEIPESSWELSGERVQSAGTERLREELAEAGETGPGLWMPAETETLKGTAVVSEAGALTETEAIERSVVVVMEVES